MGELVNLAEYRKKKEEAELREIEDMKDQLAKILEEIKLEESPQWYTHYCDIASVYNPDDYRISLTAQELDGYSEWRGTEEEFSYYADYGEED
tara:strand:- start:239 stop:517 length:279 start_codon:yes stop_codon:yes gene_type:complete